MDIPDGKEEKHKVPKVVEDLIERYKRNQSEYKSKGYNEFQLRNEFITPFFEALGWDVYNKSGSAPAYRDVILEDSIKIGGETKAPDYCFTLSGHRMFFVETKKPSVSVKKDAKSAFQLRRYAWSSKLPLSILTNFEEFIVYECRQRPHISDKPDVEKIISIPFTKYTEKWDEIYNIFSFEAVKQGSFDRFVEEAKKKRGTQEVDDEFLKEIEDWREKISKNIAIRNSDLSVRELNYSVQRTIDRIIFLRMCEDKGIEKFGQLQAIAGKDNIYSELCEVFKKADEKYNSGLFHFKKESNRNTLPDELTLNLQIDDNVLKNIFRHLYYPNSPYEFSVISPEILGNVYEQFLGKIIRLTEGHRAKIEEKPEVKKAGGVYYTPQYIVDFIVDNTVKKLCKNKTLNQISKIKILDPACGSGSFLLGAYSSLLQYHLDYYSNSKNPGRYKNEIYKGKDGGFYLTIKEKKRILLNNIYGVDIDSQAVEVTKLSLLLKVLEGESRDVFEKQQKLWPERALPDLGNNIKCGNSLIGPDFYNGGVQSSLFDEDQMFRINIFDWSSEFPEIMSSGGFDAVIGNPPYVRSIWLKDMDPISWSYYKIKYEVAKEREYDIYLPFLEKGSSLINENGYLGFIMPNKWLHAKMGEKTRSLFSKSRVINQIINFKSFQIFKGATNYTMLIFLTGKENTTLDIHQYIGPIEKIEKVDLNLKDSNNWEYSKINYKSLSDEPWTFSSKNKQNILDKIRKYPPLHKFLKIMQGTGTRADGVFYVEILDETKNDFKILSKETGKEHWIEKTYVKPSIKGKSVDRYQIVEKNFGLIFPYDGKNLIDESTIQTSSPKLWSYLEECRSKLESREKGRWKGKGWYCYGRPQNHDFLPMEKIIVPAICNKAEATWDDIGYYAIDSVYFADILKNDYHQNYYLALLNSKLLTFFLLETGTNLRGGYFTMKTAYIYPFPIRIIDFSRKEEKNKYEKIIELVNLMLSIDNNFRDAKTENKKIVLKRQMDALDCQIDRLIYQLYGLNENEVKLIEESTKHLY